jgi:hypothetical protein
MGPRKTLSLLLGRVDLIQEVVRLGINLRRVWALLRDILVHTGLLMRVSSCLLNGNVRRSVLLDLGQNVKPRKNRQLVWAHPRVTLARMGPRKTLSLLLGRVDLIQEVVRLGIKLRRVWALPRDILVHTGLLMRVSSCLLNGNVRRSVLLDLGQKPRARSSLALPLPTVDHMMLLQRLRLTPPDAELLASLDARLRTQMPRTSP